MTDIFNLPKTKKDKQAVNKLIQEYHYKFGLDWKSAFVKALEIYHIKNSFEKLGKVCKSASEAMEKLTNAIKGAVYKI